MGLWRASPTAGVVARKAQNLYFSPPDVRSVRVKVGLEQAGSGTGLLTLTSSATAGVWSRRAVDLSLNWTAPRWEKLRTRSSTHGLNSPRHPARRDPSMPGLPFCRGRDNRRSTSY